MDATVEIKGVQGVGMPDAEETDFVTDADFTAENGTYTIMYYESPITGLEGTKTTIEVTGDVVTVTREGMLNSKMTFREGERNYFLYDTSYGSARMELEARRISADLGEDGGTLNIDYVVNMEHAVASRNALTIKVRGVKKCQT